MKTKYNRFNKIIGEEVVLLQRDLASYEIVKVIGVTKNLLRVVFEDSIEQKVAKNDVYILWNDDDVKAKLDYYIRHKQDMHALIGQNELVRC